MKCFIFEDIAELTYSHHSGGGLVIIAKDREHASELIESSPQLVKDGIRYCEISDKEWDAVHEYEVSATEGAIFVFPDAGCC